MTTLPTLTPCTVPDCRAPIAHWHHEDVAVACTFAMRGRPCPHGDAGSIPCHAPRETAPLHLPDVEMVARKVYESDHHALSWADESDLLKDEYRRNARAVLDLIAAHQPVWVPINVDDIRPGMRVRWVRGNSDTEGSFTVRDIEDDRLYFENGYVSRQMSYAWSVDPRTVPAEPEDPRLAVVVEWSNEPAAATREEAARDLLARLDALEESC